MQATAPITIQPKLSVSTPGDIYEQEADHIAEHVMRMPDSKLQRACACGGGCSKCQTEQPGHEHQRLQTKHVGSSAAGKIAAPPIVHQVLASPGQPLDASTREFFEPRFGHDFSRVRIHTEASAAASAQAVNSLAYTVGTHIVFNSGEYDPTASNGQSLLAHELTHVVQQSSSRSMTAQPFTIGPANNPAEREADAIPAAVAADAQMPLISRNSAVHLNRSRLANTSNNEPMLNLGSDKSLACCDTNACPNDADGFDCADFDCPKETGDADAKNNLTKNPGHKFSPRLKCDSKSCDNFKPTYTGSELVVAMPNKREKKGKNQCDQTLGLCAKGKSIEVTIREFSNHNVWEASPGVWKAFGVDPDAKSKPDLFVSIFDKDNDPDMKDDAKCKPKPPSKAAPKKAPAKEN